jgi:hypothetical protein
LASTLQGGTVFVENLGEINRLINQTGLKVGTAMRKGLLEAGEPIRVDAGRLARSRISGLRRTSTFGSPAPWSIQKVGQTIHEVYIVPKQKGIKGRKTPGQDRRAFKFVELMYSRSYDPALARNAERTRVYVDNWIGRVTREFAA